MRLDAFDAGMSVRVHVDFACGNVFEPMRPFADSLPRPAGNLKDRRVGVEFAKVAQELVVVEIRVRQEIDLVQYERADFVEQQRILTGFVVTFGDAENSDLGIFTEIKLGRAGDVANIFNKDEVERIEIEFAEPALDERRFEVARAAGK